ncbi:alpha-amylase family glycosyl hydrolase [Bacillus sp. V5-8f]|uniref:alpha-amylase family glycosyl hydrolase n=1 Tax=Bacillus sp. V5-8f TaxID=2053044 RepID=UPI000C77CA10|nr:alpha-amylase family glycosyl hydrolase [Bacillus sp. V5-8f]PLT33838.1 alpha-amlyase [Bacillus sp. V5-8f]
MVNRVLALVLIPFLLFNGLKVSAVEKEERSWQDEVIYSLMVDRFNDGNTKNANDVNVTDPTAYNGGDFKGIEEQLDYIKDMGFTAISLTPVFDNEDRGYHGYWIRDFYKTEEHFGTIEGFKKLVKEAHKRDMKIIVEFPVNHVGPNHPWLNDPDKKDWFLEKSASEGRNAQGGEHAVWAEDLPELNLDNQETRTYFLDAAKWWVHETDIDGYSLGRLEHAPKDFWTDFSKAVKVEKQDFFLAGQITEDEPQTIEQLKKIGIDGIMDMTKAEQLREAFSRTDRPLSEVVTGFGGGESSRNMMSFIDNYEMSRFTNEAMAKKQHPGTRWKMALSYLYTVPGMPAVYYGTEIAMNGGKVPDNHQIMAFKAEQELIVYITKLAELRKQLPSLTKGDVRLLYEKDGMLIFKRTYRDETAIIAINNTSKSQTVTLDKDIIEEDKELRGLLAGDLVRSKGEKYTIVLDREVAEVYVLTDKSGLNVPYLAIMGAVYAAFAVFIIVIWKRARRDRG